jgi:hypothetical protein
MGHVSQPFEGYIALLRSLDQPQSDVLAAFVISTVWQTPADFFQNDIHVRGSAFINPGHLHAPDHSDSDVIGSNRSG